MSSPFLPILIVEDEPAHVEAIRRALEADGTDSAQILVAGTLRGFRESVAACPPAIALVDLNLPDGRAVEILSAPVETNPFPVLIMTSYGNEQTAVEALKSGALDYVVKSPETFSAMPRTVARALREWTLLQERKRAEKELRESNERFRMLFEHSIDAIMLTRTDGGILAANPEACRIFAMSEEEICRAGRAGLVDLEDSRAAQLLEQRRRTGRCRGEITMIRGDGSRFPAEISSAVFADLHGIQNTSLVIRDVTERKSLEKQLRQAQKMEAVGTLAGGIAHDFNNILTAIIGYSTLLQMDLQASGKPREYIDNIMALVDRAASLTRGLLAFSRNEAMTYKLVNLNDIVATITKLISRLIGENIAVETHLWSAPLTINADCGQIEQVLINLATNARDAMSGGGKLQIATELVNLEAGDQLLTDSCPPGAYALLSVSDTGSGMDEATMARIFEPFFTTKEPGKGTGLGLAILYGIISQHNGFVTVSSRPGSGTTFSAYIPFADSAETTAQVTDYRPVIGGTETVLIAEDDPAIRTVISSILQQFGYRVIEAADGCEAEEKFRDQAAAISLVILDTIMPCKNGKEAFATIVRIKPGVRTLFVSGYPAEAIAQRGLLPEKAAFMPKPISPMALLRNIRQLLDGERPETGT